MGLYKTQGEEPLHTFNWAESETPSSAVVIAISKVSGDDPTTIEPLYNVIDSDSLNSFFASAEALRFNGSVEFEYHNHHILIKSDGRGFIYEQSVSRASMELDAKPTEDCS